MPGDVTRVALFPLSNVVLFPNVKTPLHIFEPRYRQLMRPVSRGGSAHRHGGRQAGAPGRDAWRSAALSRRLLWGDHGVPTAVRRPLRPRAARRLAVPHPRGGASRGRAALSRRSCAAARRPVSRGRARSRRAIARECRGERRLPRAPGRIRGHALRALAVRTPSTTRPSSTRSRTRSPSRPRRSRPCSRPRAFRSATRASRARSHSAAPSSSCTPSPAGGPSTSPSGPRGRGHRIRSSFRDNGVKYREFIRSMNLERRCGRLPPAAASGVGCLLNPAESKREASRRTPVSVAGMRASTT